MIEGLHIDITSDELKGWYFAGAPSAAFRCLDSAVHFGPNQRQFPDTTRHSNSSPGPDTWITNHRP